MSEQSLRDALKELADQRDSVSGHVASDYHIRPYELHELLAAHPAVPYLAPKVDRGLRESIEEMLTDVDGNEYEHVDGCEGEDTCPACWVKDLRFRLYAHPLPKVDREALFDCLDATLPDSVTEAQRDAAIGAVLALLSSRPPA